MRTAPGDARGRSGSWVYLLFLPPFIGLLFPPFYAHTDPTLGGIPFFVWYQFLWVFITAALTATVYKLRTGLPFFGRDVEEPEAGLEEGPSAEGPPGGRA